MKAVRIERFTGAVIITFEKPVSVKLSPILWKDGFQTQARCRTLLVDLLEGIKSKTTAVSYTFRAAQ